MSTVTALLILSDIRTFERYLVVSALVAEIAKVAMSKVTVSLSANDEDTDSFDDFAAQCRWYRDGSRKPEQRLVTANVVRLFAAKGEKTGKLIQKLDNGYQQEWLGFEYLWWRIYEAIGRPAIPEMAELLDECAFRLEKNKQESMNA